MLNSKFLSGLTDKYQSLGDREKNAIMIALAAVVVFAFFQFAYFPLTDKKTGLQATIENKEKELSELRAITGEYQKLKSNDQNVTRRKSFNLFSTLETIATQSGLKKKIDYMKPGLHKVDTRRDEKWVEIKMSSLNLKELAKYLYRVQSMKNGIFIKRLSLRKNGDYLDLIIQPAVIETR